jgi:Sec-independent protein secretion pathway component TatC
MSNHSNQPKTFGERFKDEGLTGILKNKNKDAKSNPNEMHFLEHLEELRWVIFKAVLAFLLGCVGVAIFMQDSVKLLQMPLISAVEDFGVIDIDLQTIGLDQYIEPLNTQEVDLGMLRNAKDDSLVAWGIDDPHHRTRILTHFASGHNRNLLQVIRSYSPIFIAMKICFLGGIGISLPLILYFVGSFVVPGLTKDEKKFSFPDVSQLPFYLLLGHQ